MTKPPSPMGELAAALAAAQGELRDPGRNKAGQVRGKRDYRYVGLDDLLQTIRPVLSKHGLAVTQVVGVLANGSPALCTKLLHSGGGVLESAYPLDFNGGLDNPRPRPSSMDPRQRASLLAWLTSEAARPLIEAWRAQVPEPGSDLQDGVA